MKNKSPIAAIVLAFSSFMAHAQPAADSANTIYEKPEVEAAFPGGKEAWTAFLNKNLNPAVPAYNRAPEGEYTIVVRFLVDTSGKTSKFSPLTNFGYGMEEEVMRVMRRSPAWIPAQLNGRKVRSYMKQSVTFYLSFTQ